MPAERLRLGEVLVEAGVLSKRQLLEALELQKDDGRRLGTILLGTGFISEGQLVQALSKQLSLPWVSIEKADPPDHVLQLVPPGVASQFGLVPVYVRSLPEEGESLFVAMDDPTNELALRAVAATSGMNVRPMVAAPSEIARAILEFYEDEEQTGQIQLPASLLEATEASGRYSVPMGPGAARDTDHGVASGRATEASGGAAPETDEILEVELADEEYLVVGPAPPEEWQGGSTAGAVFSPGVPERERTDERPLPERLETAHLEVVEEDTDRFLLPEARGLPPRRPPGDRDEELEAGGREGDAGEPEEPTGEHEGGTVDEKLEAIEARIAASEQALALGRRRVKRKRRSVSVTLLDGTRIDFRGKGAGPEGPRPWTVRELVEALRAVALGLSPPRPLPSEGWESYVADILEALVSKGLLDEEAVLRAPPR